MTDPNNFSPLQLESVFNASATTLFDAWTFSPVAQLWLFQNGKKEIDFMVDLKEGKKFYTTEKDGNHSIRHKGTYQKISRPNHLVFSLEVPDQYEGISEVSVEIKEQQVGSHLTLAQNVGPSTTEESWKTMFDRLNEVLATPYIITQTSEAKELITAINVVAMKMAGFIMTMTEVEINRVPYRNSWTAAQLIRHIIKSVTLMAAAIKRNGKPAKREITEQIPILKQTFLDITLTLHSPDIIVPELINYTKNALLKELEVCLHELKKNTSTADVTQLAEGLPMGSVTKLEILHFLLYHSQRHLQQMKRIAVAIQLKEI